MVSVKKCGRVVPKNRPIWSMLEKKSSFRWPQNPDWASLSEASADLARPCCSDCMGFSPLDTSAHSLSAWTWVKPMDFIQASNWVLASLAFPLALIRISATCLPAWMVGWALGPNLARSVAKPLKAPWPPRALKVAVDMAGTRSCCKVVVSLAASWSSWDSGLSAVAILFCRSCVAAAAPSGPIHLVSCFQVVIDGSASWTRARMALRAVELLPASGTSMAARSLVAPVSSAVPAAPDWVTADWLRSQSSTCPARGGSWVNEDRSVRLWLFSPDLEAPAAAALVWGGLRV